MRLTSHGSVATTWVMNKLIIALAVLSACGDNAELASDGMPAPSDATIETHTTDAARAESRGCMGNLPNSRSVTIAPGDPIPPTIIGELQDMIIGAKRPQISSPVAAGAFFCESGSGVYANGLWSGATSGTVKLVYGLDIQEGDQINDILFYVGPSGTPTVTLSRQSINDGGVTTGVITAGGGAIGSWGAIDLATGSGTLSLPHVINVGFQYFLTVSLAAHTAPLQFGGAIILRARP